MLHRAVDRNGDAEHAGRQPAGQRCANLNDRNECTIYGKPERPAFCKAWQPSGHACGRTLDEAMKNIAVLEKQPA